MGLRDIAAGTTATVAWQRVGQDAGLAAEVQQRMVEAGLLDVADGEFAPVSRWAVAQWMARMGLRDTGGLDAALARALLSDRTLTVFPLRTDAPGLASRVVAAMLRQGHVFCRHPEALNIVYVEGLDPDGRANGNPPNQFNDLRMVLRCNDAGQPVVVESWAATSEPGHHHTVVHKLDPRGAARIAFGQYKAWAVGTHMAGRPSAHEALVQVSPIDVCRDLDENFQREGDAVFHGVFGINQHAGFDLPFDDIGHASAGCLVGRTRSGHRSFMSMCKADPRYQASHAYRFMTAVLPAEAL